MCNSNKTWWSVLALLAAISVNTGLQAAPQAVCVPWVSSNPDVPHYTYSGATAQLMGIARNLSGIPLYRWDFGDGDGTGWALITDPYNLGATHVYEGNVGQVFVATLYVSDFTGTSTDNFLIKIYESSDPRDPAHLDVRINMAIDKGLWNLHKTMTRGTFEAQPPGYGQDFGYWNTTGSVGTGAIAAQTATAVTAFELHGARANGDLISDPYVETVLRGLNALIVNANPVAIDEQPAGNPDVNANGIGLVINPENEITYTGGLAGQAIANSGAPNRPALVGQNGVYGRTYADITADLCEYFYYGLTDEGDARGAWRYEPNSGQGDMSATQWPFMTIIAAEENMNVEVPHWVRDEQLLWLDFDQNNTLTGFNGGYGYQDPAVTDEIDPGKTGAALINLFWAGRDAEHQSVQKAFGYIYRNWDFPGYTPFLGSSYHMYGVMKACRQPRPNILRIHDYDYNNGMQLPTSFDWYYYPYGQTREGLAHYIVRTQLEDGAWEDVQGYLALTGALPTAWNILILYKAVSVIPPTALICDCENRPAYHPGQDVPLDGSCSYHRDQSLDIVLYEWDFDYDGVNFDVDATGQQVTVAGGYANVGTYQVALRVSDNFPDQPQTNINVCTVEITTAPACPQADAGGPYVGAVSSAVDFDGSNSFDPDDDITDYLWDFDNDGAFDDATGPNAQWTFNQPGVFTVALLVRDSLECEDIDYTTVDIGNQPPVADPGGPYLDVPPNTTITLDGSNSFDPDPDDTITYSWDFNNDGIFGDATGESPDFPTGPQGSPDVTVCLRVTDPFGEYDVECTTVQVVAGDPPECDAGGPYVVECQGGVTSVELSAQYDENWSYEWDTDCPGAIFGNADTATPTLTVDTSEGVCQPGINCVVALTVGNGVDEVSCLTTVTIVDATAPVFDEFPDDLTVPCLQPEEPEDPEEEPINPYLPEFTGEPTASDDCGTVEITYEDVIDYEDECPTVFTITRTWRAEDPCGLSVQQVQVITVEDTLDPVFETFPDDMTIECGDPSGPGVTGLPEASDNCTDVTLSHADEVTPGDCGNERTIARTWRGEDLCGNFVEQTQQITIVDTSQPVFDQFPDDLTIECGDSTEPEQTGEPLASDNCGDITLTYSDVSETIEGVTTITRTWRADDECGFFIEQDQILTIEDTEPPYFTAFPSNTQVECGDSIDPEFTGTPDGQDDCGDAILTYADAEIIPTCGDAGTIIRTWRLEDEIGLFVEQNQEITLVDTTPPIFESFPEDIEIDCDDSIDPEFTGQPVATDSCGQVTLTYSDENEQGQGQFTITRTWRAQDDCGNFIEQNQIIIVSDTTAPVFDSFPIDAFVECGESTDPSLTGEPTGSDACGGVTITYADEVAPGQCGNTEIITRTWRITDDAGNFAERDQIITTEDTTPPVYQSFPDDAVIECGNSVDPADTGEPTGSDTCGDITLTYQDASEPGDCGNTEYITRTWTLTDDCGNAVDQIQIITTVDTTPPVFDDFPDDVAYDCVEQPPSLEPEFTGEPAASDICGGLTVTYADVSEPGCGNTVTITRTWVAEDDCGNQIAQDQIVAVVDNTPPTITNPAADRTVECDGLGNPTDLDDWLLTNAGAEAVDDCGTINWSNDFVALSDDCGETGQATVVFSATDECGNVATTTATFTIEDTEPPILTSVPENIVVPAEIGGCSAIVDVGQVEGLDSCSTEVVGDGERDDGLPLDDPYPAGDTLITWSAVDACGNLSSEIGTQLITVNGSPSLVLRFTEEDSCVGPDPNSNIVVTLWMRGICDNGPQAAGYQAFLQFDPEILQFIPADSFMTEEPFGLITVPLTANPDGSINLAAGINPIGGQDPVHGDWLLAELHFDVIAGSGLTAVAFREHTPPTRITELQGVEFSPLYLVDSQELYIDGLAPTVQCPPDHTVECSDGLPQPVDNATDFEALGGLIEDDSENYDHIVDVAWIEDIAEGQCPTLVTRSYLMTDCAGNEAECAYQITVQDTTPPAFEPPPADISVNADAGLCTATIAPPTPTVVDLCDPNAAVTGAARGDGLHLEDPYPLGDTLIVWTAEDQCGNVSQYQQLVTVDPFNEIRVDLEIKGVNRSFSRCITFTAFNDQGEPVVVQQVLPFEVGRAQDEIILVPCGVYNCITARDHLHTLTRTDVDNFTVDGLQYVANFTDMEAAGGDNDALISGDLNADNVIDMLDYGIYLDQEGANYGSSDTNCDTLAPHADFTGDGGVSPADFSFIWFNFGYENDDVCDVAQQFAQMSVPQPEPIRSINVNELYRRGLGHLAIADINRDGVLDEDDIRDYMRGKRITTPPSSNRQR